MIESIWSFVGLMNFVCVGLLGINAVLAHEKKNRLYSILLAISAVAMFYVMVNFPIHNPDYTAPIVISAAIMRTTFAALLFLLLSITRRSIARGGKGVW